MKLTSSDELFKILQKIVDLPEDVIEMSLYFKANEDVVVSLKKYIKIKGRYIKEDDELRTEEKIFKLKEIIKKPKNLTWEDHPLKQWANRKTGKI